MTQICLITPRHLSTNPRLVKEADALVEAGYDVRVIAADFTKWARNADSEFVGRRWRLEKKLKFGPLAPRTARVTQVARQRSARLCVKLGLRAKAIDCAAHHPIGPDLLKAARRTPADLYIAHYVAALPAAAGAAKANGAAYAFDAEDFHLGELPDSRKHEFEKRLIRAIEASYLPGCAYISAASPGIAAAYAEIYCIPRPQVVLNVFLRSQGADAPTPRGTAKPGPSVYWFSQTIGSNRGLERAVEAIARAQTRPHLYLRGTPAAGFAERLREIAAANDVTNQVHILAPDDPEKMAALAANYDVGLCSEPGATQNNSILLSNKLFTYLLAGIPPLMSDTAGQRAFAEATNMTELLFPADDSEGLAADMDRLFSDPSRLATARDKAWTLGRERYNWETESRAFVETIRKALEASQHEQDLQSMELHERDERTSIRHG